MPPRRKKKTAQLAYVWGDTPEIQALGAGFAREGYFGDGFNTARGYGNSLIVNETAIPEDAHHPQTAFLKAYWHPAGDNLPFLAPRTAKQVIGELKAANPGSWSKSLSASTHDLNAAYELGEFTVPIPSTPKGWVGSKVEGLTLFRAHRK